MFTLIRFVALWTLVCCSHAATLEDTNVEELGATSGDTTAERSSFRSSTFSYHKDLFPLDWRDGITIIICSLGLMVAAGGGIGGGGFLVPMYILIMNFQPKHAIALSNVTILGGAIANTIFNVRTIHPLKSGVTSIDWDIILMMEPATILGAVIGSFLSKFLPGAILMLCLSIILSLMAYRMLQKALKMWRDETSARSVNAYEMSTVASTPPIRPLLAASNEADAQNVFVRLGDGGADDCNVVGNATTPKPDPVKEVNSDANEETVSTSSFLQRHQIRKILYFLPLFIGSLLLTIFRGGGSIDFFFKCGSVGFWLISLANIPWALFFCCIFRKMLLRQHADRVQRNLGYSEYEIRWDARTTIRYPALCSFAGLFAGLFGVGGGIVKGPLMLEMGVQPQVAAATSATMILFTTMTATTSFLFFGLLDINYAIFLAALGFVCTTIGQACISHFMKRSNRQSPVVFSIGIVIAVSSVVIFVESIVMFVRESQPWQTQSLCPKS